MTAVTVEDLQDPKNMPENGVFVFGSNSAGVHGAGAALFAKLHFGALQGVGHGHYGHSYAIPTKDKNLRVKKLEHIALDIEIFLTYAKRREDLVFFVTRVGCGLAGFTEDQIKPLFKNAPKNCILPKGWRD